jgi:hypothetical protein
MVELGKWIRMFLSLGAVLPTASLAQSGVADQRVPRSAVQSAPTGQAMGTTAGGMAQPRGTSGGPEQSGPMNVPAVGAGGPDSPSAAGTSNICQVPGVRC